MDSDSEQSADSRLVRRAAAGDEAAFAEIVRRYSTLVLAVTRRRLGNSGHAEDAAQQVFIALSRKLGKGRAIPCLRAWLQRAAVYEAAGIARRESRHRRRVEGAAILGPTANSAPADHGLDRALASLPARDREILLLHYFEKLPYASVADRLQMSSVAAQRRGHRALEKLARLMRRQGMAATPASCAAWLGGPVVPGATDVPAGLVRRLSSVKVAAHPLAWLALPAAAVVLSAGVVVTVTHVRRPAGPDAEVVAADAARPRMPRERQAPAAAEELDDDHRTFIEKAQADAREAWEWVKQRPEGPVPFLREGAMRALADRDLAAAGRFLAAVEGRGPRREILTGIFDSRAEDSFQSAIVWLDSVATDRELVAADLISSSYTNAKWRDLDYAGALELVRRKPIREWLIRQACEKAAALDEAQIEALGARLEGEERLLAVAYQASLMLQRGDPEAFERLSELEGNFLLLPDPDLALLRDPVGLLDRALDDSPESVASLLRAWSLDDAEAAVAWLRKLDAGQRRELRAVPAMDGTVDRLLEQP